MTFISNTPNLSSSFSMRALLWFSISIHVLEGVLTLLLFFPFTNQQSKQRHIQKWSSKLLNIFGCKLQVINSSILPSTPFLLSSNHISWLDIHAINAFQPIRFVAKSEVRAWPIFGWMAKQLGTVFINRGSSKHAVKVVSNMVEVLKSESICIFPEGTSTSGKSVKPFKANLFEAAVVAQAPVYSLAIEYVDLTTGLRSEVAAFIGDMGLLESMSKLLKHRQIQVNLCFLHCAQEAQEPSKDRKWLAARSHEEISRYLCK